MGDALDKIDAIAESVKAIKEAAATSVGRDLKLENVRPLLRKDLLTLGQYFAAAIVKGLVSRGDGLTSDQIVRMTRELADKMVVEFGDTDP